MAVKIDRGTSALESLQLVVRTWQSTTDNGIIIMLIDVIVCHMTYGHGCMTKVTGLFLSLTMFVV